MTVPGAFVRNEGTLGLGGVARKSRKKPLCSNRQGKISEQKLIQNSGSRKRAVFSTHSSSTCLLQQRAG
jgi:hypothetical protein